MAMKSIRRFGTEWIVQHALLVGSFALLVATGFTLKFNYLGWVQFLGTIGLTEAVLGVVHRVAAVLLIGTAIYHLYYILFSAEGKGELKALCVKPGDVVQFYSNMKYHLGLSWRKPEVGRYGYIEKVEYWSMVWGTALMTLTGLVLWAPGIASSLLPAWIVEVSRTVHYYEAVLATLGIIVYHFFFTIFHPQEYPLNLTGFTGKITEDEAREKYPTWYEEMKRREKGEAEGE